MSLKIIPESRQRVRTSGPDASSIGELGMIDMKWIKPWGRNIKVLEEEGENGERAP